MQKRTAQSGFGIVGAIIAIALIGAIGLAGWFTYQHAKKSVTTTHATGNPSQTTQSTTTPTSIISYLTITEWGIKIPLSDNIKDAYYVPGVGSTGSAGVTNQIYLGLRSLDTNGCTAAGNNHGQDSALATIFRSKPGDVDPVTNKLLTQEHPDGVTIGNYFYAEVGYNSTNISSCKAPQARIQSTNTAFATGAKGIVSATASSN